MEKLEQVYNLGSTTATLEQSKILKRIGFNHNCSHYYDEAALNEIKLIFVRDMIGNLIVVNNKDLENSLYAAPQYSQIKYWLRNSFRMDIQIIQVLPNCICNVVIVHSITKDVLWSINSVPFKEGRIKLVDEALSIITINDFFICIKKQ